MNVYRMKIKSPGKILDFISVANSYFDGKTNVFEHDDGFIITTNSPFEMARNIYISPEDEESFTEVFLTATFKPIKISEHRDFVENLRDKTYCHYITPFKENNRDTVVNEYFGYLMYNILEDEIIK